MTNICIYISPCSYYYFIRKNQIPTYSFSEYLEYKKKAIVALFPNCNFKNIIQKTKLNIIE